MKKFLCVMGGIFTAIILMFAVLFPVGMYLTSGLADESKVFVEEEMPKILGLLIDEFLYVRSDSKERIDALKFISMNYSFLKDDKSKATIQKAFIIIFPKIVSQICKEYERSKSANIAYNLMMEPFVYDKQYLQGIRIKVKDIVSDKKFKEHIIKYIDFTLESCENYEKEIKNLKK